MTATMEEEVLNKLQEEIQAFKMPRPHRGQSVLWYPNADVNGNTEVVSVLKAGERNIEIRPASGLPRTAVFHINDPRLKQSPQIRENGAWDFTDHDKAEIKSIGDLAALTEEVKDLKAAVAELRNDLKRSNKKPE